MIERIIYDVDGVLLDWVAGFNAWAQGLGYRLREGNSHAYSLAERFHGITQADVVGMIERFNGSSACGDLPWIEGARRGITVLRNSFPGSQHVVVTACGLSPETVLMRARQLRGLKLDEMRIVGLGESKADFFRGGDTTLVIEDNVGHLEDARKAGCLAIALDQPWNQKWDGARAKDWSELPALVREMTGKAAPKKPARKAPAKTTAA